jgi:cardiolipin synthase
LQTYIFEYDDFGRKVINELVYAAHRGVQVFLLVDAVGSRNLLNIHLESLIMAGGHFIRFNEMQIKWIYRWGRRLHHKVLLIDQISCIIGGINVCSPFELNSTIPRLDFALYLEGPVIHKVNQYCRMILRNASDKKLVLPELYEETLIHPKGLDVSLSVNDWVYGHRKITRQYSRLTTEAQNEITIINSYFFPRKKFMKQLALAAKRGVRVRLILPTFSDWPSYILASEYLYAYFLKNGIEIYQWNKSILHGKIASIDGVWSTVGSYNLNYTSYQQNLEININIYSKDFSRKLNLEIEKLIAEGCVKIDPEKFIEKSSFKVRVSRFFYYIILALVANFSIGLTFQEENNKESRFYNIVRVIASFLFFILGIIGIILPLMPGIPFLIISFLLVYQRIILNKKE